MPGKTEGDPAGVVDLVLVIQFDLRRGNREPEKGFIVDCVIGDYKQRTQARC